MSEPVMDAAMSFQKAADLLRLAEMATSRHLGVGLADIESEFAVDRRTAQRMTKAANFGLFFRRFGKTPPQMSLLSCIWSNAALAAFAHPLRASQISTLADVLFSC